MFPPSKPKKLFKDLGERIFQSIRTGWGLLYFAGFGYIPGGILLVMLSWEANPGPYEIGMSYPYGDYLNAWLVTNGFAFIAFGLLFIGIVEAACRFRSRYLWIFALFGFLLIWFPHAFMGFAFILTDPTLESLSAWLPAFPFIIGWMLMATLGFLLSWKQLCLKNLKLH